MDRGVWQATVHGVAKSQTRYATEHAGTQDPMKIYKKCRVLITGGAAVSIG